MLAAQSANANRTMQPVVERLKSGWQPTRQEIRQLRIPQFRLTSWGFVLDESEGVESMKLRGWLDEVDDEVLTTDVLWIDPDLRWALCDDHFYWLQ